MRIRESVATVLAVMCEVGFAHGQIIRISETPQGEQLNGPSYGPSVSADGRFVAFLSDATNLHPADKDTYADVYLRDTSTGAITLVSVNAQGEKADRSCYGAQVIGNGEFVFFTSGASNLNLIPDTYKYPAYYWFDRNLGYAAALDIRDYEGELVGRGDLAWPDISSDGRYFAFEAQIDLDGKGTGGVFVYDRMSGAVRRASFSHDGKPVWGWSPQVSDDGQVVAYLSNADFIVPGDTNNVVDVFVYDFRTAAVKRVSVRSDGVEQNDEARRSMELSADGKTVMFMSTASNLDADRSYDDAFIHDIASGQTRIIGLEIPGGLSSVRMSRDAKFALFAMAYGEDWLADLTLNRSARVSNPPAGGEGAQYIFDGVTSYDMNWIAFEGSFYLPNDTNNSTDVYFMSLQPMKAFVAANADAAVFVEAEDDAFVDNDVIQSLGGELGDDVYSADESSSFDGVDSAQEAAEALSSLACPAAATMLLTLSFAGIVGRRWANRPTASRRNGGSAVRGALPRRASASHSGRSC
ncbi:MAG: PD40 domain-containing protein [Phycisphaerae bacterium]|jgi:hypothetical protein